jgi:hypothetical protein
VTGRWGDIDGVWTDPVIAQVMMTLFLDFFMGLGLRVCACGFDGFHGPGCLLRVWAILSHARGPCHLNRNNQLIGFPVLRCSEERPPAAAREPWLDYNFFMPQRPFRRPSDHAEAPSHA